jgi:ATP-dependent RNA helicase RhlE
MNNNRYNKSKRPRTQGGGPAKNGRRRPNGNGNRNGNGKGKKKSTLNPALLVNQTVINTTEKKYEGRRFDELDLNPRLQDNISNKGYEMCTEIQDRTCDRLLEGQDALGIANTGTGKTGAFLIPIINQWLDNPRDVKTLILAPTRELAMQIQEEFNTLSKGFGMKSLCLIGGTSVSNDIRSLRRPQNLIVGTPGRIADMIQQRALRLGSYTTLVLDEFDRMLDMGFIHEVRRITSQMNERQQTILFSATENRDQRKLVDEFLDRPFEVRVSDGQKSADHIKQDVLHVPEGENKFHILLDLMNQDEFEKVIVFDETKRRVSKLALKLRKSGVLADDIHGDKSQNQRKRALDKFKKGAVKVLVATDVAARGIDVDDITHVINYQVPGTMESYIHRIGRTGRAGKAGQAITLVEKDKN